MTGDGLSRGILFEPLLKDALDGVNIEQFKTQRALTGRIRALGPNFHALAEVNFTAWSNWVTANATTFYAAGQQARRNMAAAGSSDAATARPKRSSACWGGRRGAW